jgi:serine-type D-Ala-D-Ala carboxypeptidase/endopeptidase
MALWALEGERERHATGTDEDLRPAPAWTFDALAGAGALVSTARDQLAMIEAQLEAAAGSKELLRPAMRLTQEAQLARERDNMGLGWQIDGEGRYWHNGGTGGFHSFVGFDPKARRGVVVLASTSLSLVDHLGATMFRVLAGEESKPPVLPTPEQLAPLAGSYDFQGIFLKVIASGKRLYIEGPGEPRIRMIPLSPREFWIEPLQTVVVFEQGSDGKITRAVFVLGDRQMSAPRVQ